LRPLVEKPGGQTATEKSIDTAESHRSLTQWTRNLESTLREAFKLSAQWQKIDPGEVVVDVSDDFGLSMLQASEIKDLIEMHGAGLLSPETFLSEVKRRGFFSDGFSERDELERIARGAKPPEPEPNPDPEPDPT